MKHHDHHQVPKQDEAEQSDEGWDANLPSVYSSSINTVASRQMGQPTGVQGAIAGAQYTFRSEKKNM